MIGTTTRYIGAALNVRCSARSLPFRAVTSRAAQYAHKAIAPNPSEGPMLMNVGRETTTATRVAAPMDASPNPYPQSVLEPVSVCFVPFFKLVRKPDRAERDQEKAGHSNRRAHAA